MKAINIKCEVKMKFKYGIFVLVLISLLVLTGCKKDQNVNSNPAADGSKESYPAQDNVVPQPTQASYPAPATPESIQSTQSTTPGYPAPANAPVRENASLMQVEILSLAKSEKSPDFVIAHVRVNTTAATAGLDEYDPNLAGQELDILLAAGDADSLAVGNIINLTVSYRGDEWGGGYYGRELSLAN